MPVERPVTIPATIAIVAPLSGMLADRIGSRVLAVSGMAISTVGLVLLARIGADASLPHVVGALLVTGVGQSMFQPANNSALMGAAPGDQQGAASGILATARIVGQSLSIAVAGAIFASLGAARAGRALASGAPTAAQAPVFLHGFHVALLVCAAITVVAAAASLLRGRERGRERERHTTTARRRRVDEGPCGDLPSAHGVGYDYHELHRMIALAIAESDVEERASQPASHLAKVMLEALDTNRDGRLSFDELEAAVQARPELLARMTRSEAIWIAPNEELLLLVDEGPGTRRARRAASRPACSRARSSGSGSSRTRRCSRGR